MASFAPGFLPGCMRPPPFFLSLFSQSFYFCLYRLWSCVSLCLRGAGCLSLLQRPAPRPTQQQRAAEDSVLRLSLLLFYPSSTISGQRTRVGRWSQGRPCEDSVE